MQTEIIKTLNLTKTYNGVSALKNLNLTVNRHSIFGFLGPNGAGKSTTIKLLIGLIQPTAGGGKIFGYDIKNESMKIRARIGYLPQEPSFYDHLSAREVLEFTARFFFSGSKKELNKRVSEMLDLVSLLDKADRSIKGYSTGEKRRLGIAQATINYPDLLILDEPAASLDPIGRQDVLSIMSKLQNYTTIFYSTHILDDVQKVSDSVAILNRGQLIAQGPIKDILKNKEEETIFNVKVQGDISKVKRELILQKWISNVNVTQLSEKGDYQLGITVSDDEYAQKNLIRELLNLNLTICEFQRQEYELEDVFMKLVEG
ncbi:MAG: ABC transporter ATP-binding protein [Candidatus Heimdallarchaeota archaeon]|nr:MAG: ABC transporter ATP-binding protein [Candidatus Heimdallarchaeota archaeon]